MQILASIQQLEHNTLHRRGRDRMTRGLRVVMDDLQEVVLGILEDHEDAFVFEDDLNQADYVRVRELGAERHFPDGGLGDSRVLDLFAFFVCIFTLASFSSIRTQWVTLRWPSGGHCREGRPFVFQ
jgi:hypothetical protein